MPEPAPLYVQPENPTAKKLDELLQKQLDEQAEHDAQFRDAQAAMSNKVSEVHNEIMDKLQNPTQSQQPPPAQITDPELIEINYYLLANPILVPVVKRFIEKTKEKLEACVNTTLNEII
jgi:hypothetical protein